MENKEELKRVSLNIGKIVLKLAVAALCILPCLFLALYMYMLMPYWGISLPLIIIAMLMAPALVIGMLFLKKRGRFATGWAIALLLLIIACAVNIAWEQYDQSITIDTSPNINIDEYLPFAEDSKIVRLDGEASLQFEIGDALPRIDGAAAVFPVYSAFVEAVYPENTTLSYDGSFQYNNTLGGYASLADKNTDIFFGAYPSQEQIDYAGEQGATFQYTQIGSDAFVFFVHKDNPVDDLTSEQVRAIYSGEITNWSQVGGRNEPIKAYQRNNNSGSQSMLIRFMGDTPLMDPPTDMRSGSMGGIVQTVADYRSSTASIGFSFRYYVEGIIQNPDIKLLSIDGIAPTVENIQNGTYPIITPLYAVTCEGNDNENVQLLLDWVLSEEGQYIIEQTGYTPVN